MAHRLTTSVLSDDLSSVGSAFAGTAEAHLAGGGPTDDTTSAIRDGDDGVVEGGVNVNNTGRDVHGALGLDDFLFGGFTTDFEPNALGNLLVTAGGGALICGCGRGSGCGGRSGSCCGGCDRGRFVSHGIGSLLECGLLGLLRADGLTWAFAGAGVGVRALAAHWQTTTMTMGTIAVDAKNALHVHLEFTTKVTFDRDLHSLDGLGDGGDLLVGQLTRTDVWINVGGSKNFAAKWKTDAINIGHRIFDLLFVRDFNSKQAGHNAVLDVVEKVDQP